MSQTATTTSSGGGDWFQDFVGAATDYLIARENADTQREVIYAVPQGEQIGASPYDPTNTRTQPAQQAGFTIPREWLLVGGAALAAFIVVKVV